MSTVSFDARYQSIGETQNGILGQMIPDRLKSYFLLGKCLSDVADTSDKDQA